MRHYSFRGVDININVHLNQEIYFLEEMIHDIVHWLEDDTSCLINKMNYASMKTKADLSLMKQISK